MPFSRCALHLMTALCLAPATLSAEPPSDRQFTTIDVPGSIGTQLFGANSDRDIVGSYTDSSLHVRGFLLHDGVFTTIDVPGSSGSVAYGINKQGDIVGQ